MRIYDVSVSLGPGTPTWPSDPGIEVEPADRISRGDPANVSRLSLGSHSGTHVDPPFHFIPGGATVDQLPLDVLMGAARLVEFDVEKVITAADLEATNLPAETRRLLCKTRNSGFWGSSEFHRDFVSLAPDGAEWVIRRGIRLVGIDYLSIEAFGSKEHPVHRSLLGAKVIVVEGLDLRQVAPGEYQFVCLPLKVHDGDGAPARAALIEM